MPYADERMGLIPAQGLDRGFPGCQLGLEGQVGFNKQEERPSGWGGGEGEGSRCECGVGKGREGPAERSLDLMSSRGLPDPRASPPLAFFSV